MPHFGSDKPQANSEDFGIDQGFLVWGTRQIVAIDDLAMTGAGAIENALAACALASVMAVSVSDMAHVLTTFQGLPHRCEPVAKKHGVSWYNDSKGTNIGASLSAVSQLSRLSRFSTDARWCKQGR